MLAQVSVLDIVGPFPDPYNSCLIVCRSGETTFSVPCDISEAQSCYVLLNKIIGRITPYSFANDIITSIGGHIVYTNITNKDEFIYSQVFFSINNVVMKVCSDLPAAAINTALYTGCPLNIDSETLQIVRECRAKYCQLKRLIRPLYPLPFVSSTPDLAMLSDFLDEAGYAHEQT